MYKWVSEWMIDWVSECVWEWVSEWVNVCEGEWVNYLLTQLLNVWMSGWTSDWMSGWLWMNEWIESRTKDVLVSEWMLDDWQRGLRVQWMSFSRSNPIFIWRNCRIWTSASSTRWTPALSVWLVTVSRLGVHHGWADWSSWRPRNLWKILAVEKCRHAAISGQIMNFSLRERCNLLCYS